MSNSLRHRLLTIVALVGVLALGVAVPARAGSLQIAASTSANPPAIPGDVVSTTGSFSGTIGGFAISMLATGSNSPGSPTIAELTGTTLSITNNNAATTTLYITLGATGFTGPTTPPSITVHSHVGGTVVIPDPANALTYNSYINSDNSQNGTSGMTPGAQTPGITSGSFSNDKNLTITSLTGTYSLTERFAITLSAGSQINFSSSTSLVASAIPEPSSLTLAGLGVLGMIGYGLRRRNA
jgi:hypothetical protein